MLQPKLEEKAADRMTRERVRLGRGGTTTAAGCSAVQGRLIWSELGRISAGREQSKWPSPVLSYLMHRAPGSPARTRIECCAMSFIWCYSARLLYYTQTQGWTWLKLESHCRDPWREQDRFQWESHICLTLFLHGRPWRRPSNSYKAFSTHFQSSIGSRKRNTAAPPQVGESGNSSWEGA